MKISHTAAFKHLHGIFCDLQLFILCNKENKYISLVYKILKLAHTQIDTADSTLLTFTVEVGPDHICDAWGDAGCRDACAVRGRLHQHGGGPRLRH